MADPTRLSLADQALIHLMGYLGLEIIQDATWDTFRACLPEVLAQANRGIPVIEHLAALGDRMVVPQNRADLSMALEDARRQLRDYHKAKAARAIDALRTATGETAA